MNIIVSLVLMLATIAAGSIVWPRLTNQPRPAPLEQVYTLVKDTGPAKSLENVLGVSNEPINIASETSKLTASLIKTAQERAAKIVVTQAVRQLIAQIGNLPPEEQAQIHDLLCTTPTPTP